MLSGAKRRLQRRMQWREGAGVEWDGDGGGAMIGLGASKKGVYEAVWPGVDTWILWAWQEFPQSCICKMNSTIYIPTTLHLFRAPEFIVCKVVISTRVRTLLIYAQSGPSANVCFNEHKTLSPSIAQ